MKVVVICIFAVTMVLMTVVNIQEAKVINQQRILIKQMQENPACMVENQ